MLDVNRRLLDLVDAFIDTLNQSTCAFFESNFEIWRSIDREYSPIKIADVCERKLLVTTRHSIILSDEHVDKSFFIVMELLRLGQMRVSTSAPFSIEIDVS